jgi:hypothetical protein
MLLLADTRWVLLVIASYQEKKFLLLSKLIMICDKEGASLVTSTPNLVTSKLQGGSQCGYSVEIYTVV